MIEGDRCLVEISEDINSMSERLKLSQEELVQVINTNAVNNIQGFENWVVGRIMAEEKPNREVFRSLWFTKEEVNFVELNEDVIIVKFGCLEDRSRILNLMLWLFDNCLFAMKPFIKGKNIDTYEFNLSPFLVFDRETSLDIGKVIEELVAIDWKDRNRGWTEFIRMKVKINMSNPLRRVVKLVGKDGVETICMLKVNIVVLNQDRGIWRNDIEIMANKEPLNEDKEESKTNTEDDSGKMIQKEKRKGCEEDSVSNSPVETRNNKYGQDRLGRFRRKRKRHRGLNGDNTDKIRELKQLIVANDPDIIFLCEIKANINKFVSIRSRCRMEGCLAVNAIGKSGGLAIMWKEGIKVEIKNYSNNHIDSLIHLENDKVVRFTDYRGIFQCDSRQVEKEGEGENKKILWMIFEQLWMSFPLEGDDLVKKRLDRFLMSLDDVACFSFLETKVIRQSSSDHNVIFLYIKGCKLKERTRYPRLNFRYDVCWVKENEAKNIIKNAWQNGAVVIMEKIDKVGQDLGDWQYNKYKKMRIQIGGLQ
ncbi:hypothetical protein CXB51_000959 [Gossypium anomalum]|uniref:DUF4283 domain-containing protein n=1 Tax=Gossypium anomalum TaxID=47600 RepID=A0A8J5ZJR9_9ROSI|nr:hypothetical protein CXB51_000959 [Gossypium anomalum]